MYFLSEVHLRFMKKTDSKTATRNNGERGSAIVYVLMAGTFMTIIMLLIASRQVNRSFSVQVQRVLLGRDAVLALIANYVQDVNALRNSRVNTLTGNQMFVNCLMDSSASGDATEPNCVARTGNVDQTYSFALYTAYPLNPTPAAGNPVSIPAANADTTIAGGDSSNVAAKALYDISGKRCASSVTSGSRLCPIQVITEFKPVCSGGVGAEIKCNRANLIYVYYTVKGVAPGDDPFMPKLKTIDNKGQIDPIRTPTILNATTILQIGQ